MSAVLLAYRQENREAATDDLIRMLTESSAIPGNVKLPREAVNMLLDRLKPQQVITVAELDALPWGTIIRDSEDDAWQLFGFTGWVVAGGDRTGSETPTLPATVLHVGGAE